MHGADQPWRRALVVAFAGPALLLSIPTPSFAQKTGSQSSSNGAAQESGASKGSADGADQHSAGSYPKFSWETLFNGEIAGLAATHGPGRGPAPSLRVDSRVLYNFSDSLLIDGLFQYKPREPRPAEDPNRGLYTNQGAGRREGGKMKELYIRKGDYRVGKFVQNFGRAYFLLPGPYAADFIEESDEGYEPSEMIGVERLHVFDNEDSGWRQLTVSAFMADRTVLHRSYPYDEGRIHLHDGGIGNTRLPENVMVTYDVLNAPISNWGQLSYQAGLIRWGKPADAERGEIWSTVGGDLAIPLRGSVASTLAERYSQLRLYLEATRRDSFKGVAGRARDYLSASAEYVSGPWTFDLTTTQRWTTDRVMPLQKDAIYTTTVGYKLPQQAILSFSIADEVVDGRRGVYAGIRLTKTLTTCNRCQVNGTAY